MQIRTLHNMIALGAMVILCAVGCGQVEPTIPPVPPTNTPVPTPTPVPKAGDTRIRGRDGMTMVYVPAGEFRMGFTDAEVDDAKSYRCMGCKREWFTDAQPQHTVYLDAFWIDKTVVTNAHYRKCVEAGTCIPPSVEVFTVTYEDPSKDNHPVAWVTWDDAKTYCQWAGGRLPTEAEWEKAARGTDGRAYPWGNSEPNNNKAQYYGYGGQTVAVGSKLAGASPYGALDMAGNVWEWVADWYGSDYYSKSPSQNPQGPSSGEYRLVRGGSTLKGEHTLRTSYRFGIGPTDKGADAGFRCVVSP
jgi:eukaryotic-like serine/threonine-protein kinase